MVILDADGNELVSSFGPAGNIGCPINPSEINYFLDMIEQTRIKISDDRVAEIEVALEAYASEHR